MNERAKEENRKEKKRKEQKRKANGFQVQTILLK